jgi:hypothetical protein
MYATTPSSKLKLEGGEAMIRAVRHFLWYLEYQSTGGRSVRRLSRQAGLRPPSASDEPNARARRDPNTVVREASRRYLDDRPRSGRS